MNGNYLYMLIVTVTLLVFMCINHSRGTRRCEIIQLGLYFLILNEAFAALRARLMYDSEQYPFALIYLVLVGCYLTGMLVTILIFLYLLMMFPAIAEKKNMLQTFFFTCVSAAVLAVIVLPGLVGGKGDPFVSSGAYDLFFFGRLLLLLVFLTVVVWKQKEFVLRQYQNLFVVLMAGIVLHLFPLLGQRTTYLFGFFANTFFGMVYWLFHSAGYEEQRAHMGSDHYAREIGYHLDKRRPFFVFEVTIVNCDYLMQRGALSKEELLRVYETLFERMNTAYRGAMTFRKLPTCIGVIAEGLSGEDAQEMAGQLKTWMEELAAAGGMTYHIIGISCPQYGDNLGDIEHLLLLLQKRCADNDVYFCNEEDFAGFDARGDVLLFLQKICAEKEDMVLFCTPMINKKSSRIERFEIFGRAQMAGSGIIGSHRITDLAKQYGYSHDVNMAVLKHICEYLAVDAMHMKVSLRISSDELESPDFAADVLNIVNNFSLAPETIGFEVQMVPGQRDIEGMHSMMQLLRDNGIIFILTDFSPSAVNFEGITGLPFKTVKFESKCVRQAAEHADSFDVIGLLVDLLKERGLDVVFKGVDDEQLEETALSLGADYLEGTRYAKTLPLEDIVERLDLGGMF